MTTPLDDVEATEQDRDLARACLFFVVEGDWNMVNPKRTVEVIAHLLATEREVYARLAEAIGAAEYAASSDPYVDQSAWTGKLIADAIRARGTTEV
jgi:hypothetical protein